LSPETPDPGAPSAEESDLGPPVAELRDVSWTLKDGFSDRVRGRIERRVLTGEFLDLVWAAPLMLLLELLRLPFEALARKRRP
jgi:hypothetical protein